MTRLRRSAATWTVLFAAALIEAAMIVGRIG